MDALYGYQSVNVEAQLRSASSLLHWTRRLIAVRRNYRAFGRGTLTFLQPGNRKVLAYLREYGNEAVLCVVNLARNPQAVELDLARFEGRVPVEIMGKASFRRSASCLTSSPWRVTATSLSACRPTRSRPRGTSRCCLTARCRSSCFRPTGGRRSGT
jgi:hypothetical protein